MSLLKVDLTRGGAEVAWGFRLQGGLEHGCALSIQRVFNGSPADGQLHRGDVIKSVNGNSLHQVTLNQAHDVIKHSGNKLSLVVERDTHHADAFATAPHQHEDHHHHHPPGDHHHQQHHGDHHHHHQQPWQPEAHAATSSFNLQPHQPHQPHSSHPPHQPTYEPPHASHPPSQQPPYQPSHHFAPSNDFQHPSHPFTNNPPPPPPSHDVPFQPFERDADQIDVDRDHLKPVNDVKRLFNNKEQAAPSVSRPHAPAHVTKRFSPSLHHDTTPKYQPPLPTTRPAAATDSYNHSLKHPQVYQQRSSYNPLDFKGVNNLIKPPSREPNRPPGLVQRGADVHHSYQPPPLSKQQQEQRYHNTAHQPLPNVPSQPPQPQGNLDSMTDFYLHGLHASAVPNVADHSSHTSHTSAIASYRGKVLPPRSDPPIVAPTGASKKKEFKADSSAVLQCLQEEEKGGGVRGGPARGVEAARVGVGGGRNEQQAAKLPAAPAADKGRLAALLERDQIGTGHYQDPHHPQQYQPPQQQQHFQAQQQFQPQHHFQPQHQQQHHFQPPQHQQQQQHYRNATTLNLVSPQQQPHFPPQQHNPHHPQQQQQQHFSSHHYNIGSSGLPESDF